MIRIVLGAVVGTVAAMAAIAAVQAVGHTVFPTPPGFNPLEPDAVSRIPVSNLLAVLASYAVGAYVGGAAAAAISRRGWSAWVVSAVVLTASAANMTMISHPLWFGLCSFALIAGAGWLAGRLGDRTTSPEEPLTP